jgi:hypothetical protein
MRPGRVPPSEQEPAPGQWQEPATRPAPQWQPTPPPAPQWQPTVKDPALDPTVQQPAQGRAAQDPLPPTQWAGQDQRQQPRQQQPAQWQQPRDTPPQQPPQAGGQWAAAPQQPQAAGQWGPPPQQPQAAGQWGPPPQQPQAAGQWGPPPQQPQAAGQWAAAPQQPQAAGQWGPPPQQPQAAGQWAAAPQQPRLRRRGRNRRTRRWVMATFTIVVLLVLLVIGDRVACAITENAFASQFQSQGVPVKPSVDIEGFPFLTQLAAKDFNKVDISASNIPVSLPTGGTLTITSVHGTVSGLHISGYSSSANAKVDHITATAFISFGSLAAAGSLGGTGVTITQAGPNTVKITAGVAGLSDTEEAQITQTGPQTISIKIVDSGSGALGGLLGSIGFNSFSFTLPKVVPASLRITGLTLNSQGLTVSAAASNAVFSQS